MSEILNIGSQKQLFIDDRCIESTDRVRQNLHQAKKHPNNPLMVPEKWWESKWVQLFGNVLYDTDEKQFRMWYNVEGEGLRSTCHAVSPDGIHWTRPEHNIIEHEGRVLSNCVMKTRYCLPTVFHTPEDPDPNRRYRMIQYTSEDMVDLFNEVKAGVQHGYGVFFSADGINWTDYEHNPVIHGSDMCTCCWDPIGKEYVAFVKILSTINGKNRRMVGVSTSKDFVNWGQVAVIVSADEYDDSRVAERLYRFRDILMYDDPETYLADIYGMTGFWYENRLLGLIWLYDRSGNRPPEHGGNDEGIMNLQLVYSRDNDAYAYWERVGDRRDLLSCGEDGSYDAGMVISASTVLEVGDEIWIYYTGYTGGHNYDMVAAPYTPKAQTKHPVDGTSINLATLRRDGFVSMYANYPPGRLTTKLLTFTGSELELNADSEHGDIRVEIVDEAGQPIPGFTRDECLPFSEDSIRGKVSWQDGGDVSALQGKPVRLVFYMATCKLYAFKFN